MEQMKTKRLSEDECERLVCEHLQEISDTEQERREDMELTEAKRKVTNLSIPYVVKIRDHRRVIRDLLKQRDGMLNKVKNKLNAQHHNFAS